MAKKVKAALLIDCALGKAGDVVVADEALLKQHVGEVDTNAKAVDYALKTHPRNASGPRDLSSPEEDKKGNDEKKDDSAGGGTTDGAASGETN